MPDHSTIHKLDQPLILPQVEHQSLVSQVLLHSHTQDLSILNQDSLDQEPLILAQPHIPPQDPTDHTKVNRVLSTLVL